MFLKNLKTNEIAQFENFQDNWIEATKDEINDFLLTQAKTQKINELKANFEIASKKYLWPLFKSNRQIIPMTRAFELIFIFFLAEALLASGENLIVSTPL